MSLALLAGDSEQARLPVLPVTANLQFSVKGYAGTFTDVARTTPAANDADLVGGWAAQNGTTNNASQVTAGTRATLKTGVNGKNNRNVVCGNGAVGWFALDSTINLNDFSIYFAVKPNADSGLTGGSGTPNSQVRAIRGGVNVLSVHDGTQEAISSVLPVVAGNWMLCEFIRSGTTVSFYQNGVACGTGTVSAALSLVVIGGLVNGSANIWNADCLEPLVYNVAHNASDRQLIEAYLNSVGAIF